MKLSEKKAINATQIKVTFNRSVKASTVLDATDDTKLASSVFKLDGAPIANTNAAKLVDDKTLVINVTNGIASGAHLFELVDEKVQTKDAKSYVAAYNTNFTVNDTERAAVKEVKYDNAKTIKVYFSEPIKTLGSTTLTYADGTPLTGSGTDYTESFTSGNDYVTYTLNTSSANVKANKDITVAFAGLVDYANNTTKPTTATFKYDNSDVTAPTVSSITATSKTSFDIKFSEGVHSLDVTKLNVNGTDLTVSDKAEVDSNDSTLVHVTLDAANAQTAAVLVKVNAEFAKDFTNNNNTAFTQSVNFKADITAPAVTSTSVEKVSGKNYLIINYNENVTPATTNVDFNYTDANGVDQTITDSVLPVLYNPVDGKSKSVYIDLSTIADTTTPSKVLVEGTKYSVDLTSGFVKDLFGNSSEAKTGISVTPGTLSEATTALKVLGTVTQKANTPGVIQIAFDQKVDPTSAKDVANYTVEDATVKSVKLVANDSTNGYKVEVTLADNTVETTGTYNVTVKNVKPASTSAATVADTTKAVALDENVLPTIASAAFTTLTSTSTKVNVTFSEAVDATAIAPDFDLYVDGVKQSATVTNTASTGNKVVEVTITGYDVQAAVQAGKTVTLKTTDGVVIKDAKKNVTPAATSVTVK